MQLLLVQLSDIHLGSESNPVLERRAAIIDAIRSTDGAAEGCLLLFTGDIAKTGSEDEYSIAFAFIEELKADLQAALGPKCPVLVALIPGNHDCDLRGPQTARDLLRESLTRSATSNIDKSVIDICTEAQRSFFDLRDIVSDEAALSNLSKLYYEYHFRIGGELIEVRCLNTAWLSQLHEAEGTFVFPIQDISPRNAAASLSVSLLHHPFAWFTTPTRRALQSQLQEVSDIIFTGHEHEHTRRTQIIGTGEINQFIEGAALQTEVVAESSFNALLIDTAEEQQRFFKFDWSGDLYACVHRGEWQDFQVNQLRARHDFALTEAHDQFLEDPGAGFERAGYGRPRLSELFVFPELRRIAIRRKDTSAAVDGDKLLAEQDIPNLLISGAEQSGKTCFAKAAFKAFQAQGLVPIYVDGSGFTPQRGDRLREQLYRVFDTQYQGDSGERYRQLPKARRVVIVDNFHRIRLRSGMAERLIDDLEAFAGRLVLLTNDLAQAFGEILRAGEVIEARDGFGHYRLMPFGYVRRMELTTRWLALGNQLDEQQIAQRLTDAEQKMEVILGKNFVPSFPIFLLAMLQGLESAAQIDTGASTYGYFYELLIKSTLARGATHSEVNIAYNYLTALASEMFEMEVKQLTLTELREFHDRFVAKFDLTIDFRKSIEDLERKLVLFRFGDVYEFKYSYYYYYFVARYLSKGLASGRAEARRIVEDLANNMEDEESANVLLFLAHLSPDPLIVDLMLEKARAQFPEYKPAKLEEDVAFLDTLSPGLEKLEYEERPFQDNRLDLAKRRDRVTDEHEAVTGERDGKALSDTESDMVRELVGRLMTGLRTMQILGQVLKNHPAAFDADLKAKMATECYEIGFRALGFMLQMLREGQDALVHEMMIAIKEERPNVSDEKVIRRANGVVFGLGLVGAYGVIKRISFAVGSPDLKLTFEKVGRAMSSNATQLTNMSIQLDQAEFPQGELVSLARALEKSAMGRAVLQWMVMTHVNLFPTQFKQRQTVFDAVGIKYAGSVGANPNQRLLRPDTRAESAAD